MDKRPAMLQQMQELYADSDELILWTTFDTEIYNRWSAELPGSLAGVWRSVLNKCTRDYADTPESPYFVLDTSAFSKRRVSQLEDVRWAIKQIDNKKTPTAKELALANELLSLEYDLTCLASDGAESIEMAARMKGFFDSFGNDKVPTLFVRNQIATTSDLNARVLERLERAMIKFGELKAAIKQLHASAKGNSKKRQKADAIAELIWIRYQQLQAKHPRRGKTALYGLVANELDVSSRTVRGVIRDQEKKLLAKP
jgi:hypothetical protein